jgi:uncharacterized protein YkwD
MRFPDMMLRMVTLFSLLVFGISLASSPPATMTDRERAMIDEINYVRTKPAEYAGFIQGFLEEWDSPPSEVKAAKELYQKLTTMKPVAPLEFSPSLYTYTIKHGQWMMHYGRFDHSDFRFPYGENLVGDISDVREAVLDLLIDDGVPDRGHRFNILYPEFRYVAVHEVPGKVDGIKNVFIQQFSYTMDPKVKK